LGAERATDEVLTPRSALARLRETFRRAGLESPGLDARLLLAEASGRTPERLLVGPDELLRADEARRLDGLAARRLAGEPVARILGRREFWSLDFELSPETLVPRPETETLVETALARLAGRRSERLRIADLGTGSGCILVALLSELPAAIGIGVDRCEAALRTARRNADRHGLESRALFAACDWASALAHGFDLIVSNPPYISSREIGRLPREVARHDPHLALDGGEDGLGAYRRLLPRAAALLAPGGLLLLEVGEGQAAAVSGLLAGEGLAALPPAPDLSGVQRVVGGSQPEPVNPALTRGEESSWN